MPIHDWTRVSDGTWHDFHLAWIAEIRKALNAGLLPPDYYAQAEQIVGQLGPDVLTLQMADYPTNGSPVSSSGQGGVAVSAAPPRMRMTAEASMDDYVLKRRTIVIRHNSDDRIIALIEIVSTRFALVCRESCGSAVSRLSSLARRSVPTRPPRPEWHPRLRLGRVLR